MIGVLRVRNAPAEFLRRVLEANFHSALDAKYAVFGDVLWSTYMHPLSTLTIEGATDAVDQVSTTLGHSGTRTAGSHLHCPISGSSTCRDDRNKFFIQRSRLCRPR